MDSRVSENEGSRSLRRSTRQSSGNVKVLSFEPTPRGPLKRTKKRSENKAPVAAVNGSRDIENASDDEESPIKKRRLETGGAVGGSGDENEMDVQESVEDLEENEDQEMDIGQDSSQGTHQPKICQELITGCHSPGALGDVNLFPRVVLGERCRPSHAVNEDADYIKTKRVKPSTKGPVAPTKSATQIRSLANSHEVPISKPTSVSKHERTMKSSVISTVNHHVHVPSGYPVSEKFYTTRQRMNNIPTQKETVQQKKKDGKKTTAVKRSSGYSSRGCMWFFWRLVLFSAAVLLAYKIIPALQRAARGRKHPSGVVNPEKFADHLSLLETQFPSQRADLWKRSKIHLGKHLTTAQPTEPVSLIFTAGHKAEKTLRCLAQGLASSFSSALNASFLHINGASKASQDADEVKLDIDTQLQAAFEGDKPVAVIHRFEELPPGSTLIFYRYCDHENAAYKRVFLLFTVLLPQDEVSGEHSLKEVEEMVQDYVKERLVDSGKQTAFNEMDADKYGGLWSRIAHLILPVVSEKEVEQRGCR